MVIPTGLFPFSERRMCGNFLNETTMRGFPANPSTIMVNGNMAHELQMAFSADDARDAFFTRRVNTIETAEAFQEASNSYLFSTGMRRMWRLSHAKLLRQYRKPENMWINELFKKFGWDSLNITTL